MESDILRIRGPFLREIIRFVVDKVVRKKYGTGLDIDVRNLEIAEDADPQYLKIDLVVKVKKDDLNSLIKRAMK